MGSALEPLGAEHGALAGIEIGRHQVELALQLAKVVGAPGVGEDPRHVALESLA
jgi:hypothetical protein